MANERNTVWCKQVTEYMKLLCCKNAEILSLQINVAAGTHSFFFPCFFDRASLYNLVNKTNLIYRFS